jgi:vacuolar protein sorting-associated protein 13A/C
VSAESPCKLSNIVLFGRSYSCLYTRLSTRNPLSVVVNALTMTLGNINDAPLEFNSLAIKDMRLTSSELSTRVMYHYRQEVLRQLYRILGSADFFGNPVGLFTNVSSGVADIFYEPFNGVVMHNRDLGIGIAKVRSVYPIPHLFINIGPLIPS